MPALSRTWPMKLRLLAILEVFFLLASMVGPAVAAAASPLPSADPSAVASSSPDVSAPPSPSSDSGATASPAESAPASPTVAPATTASPSPAESASASPTVAPATTASPSPSQVGTASLIIRFVAGSKHATMDASVAADGGVETHAIDPLAIRTVDVPADRETAIRAAYLADPAVAQVENDVVRSAGALPNDPQYGTQWNLPKIGWDVAHDSVTPTKTAIIAILDTGIDASHPDLAGHVLAGYSAFTGSNAQTDPNGHGTEMAGIAAASTDNTTGIAGVAYGGVSLLPVQVLGSGGTGEDSDIIAGVVWAADHGANVILMSFSNPGYSSALQSAIDYAWSKNVVVVAATGNGGSKVPTYPAGDTHVVGVSATDQNDTLATSSNYGPDTFLAAPGEDIPATMAGGTYATVSGTSAAAAQVAGAAALLMAIDPSLTNGVVIGRLARTADPAGTSEQTGNGRLNLGRAVSDTSTDPVVPAGAPGGGPLVGPYVAAARSVRAISVGSQSGTVTYKTAGSATFLITVTPTGGGNGSTRLTVTGLPTGATGAFSGMPMNLRTGPWTSTLTVTTTTSLTPAGAATFRVGNTGNGVTGSGSLTVTKRLLTVSGITANNKGYDGGTTATLNTGSAALVGVVSGDTVTLSTAGATGTFNNKNAGTAKTVTVSGLTISGASAGNYTLTQPTTTANITARAITVTAATNSKGYDGTTSSAGVPTITTGSLAGGDSATWTQTFDTRNVGTGKTLTPSGTVNDGNGGANYTITFVNNTTGVITARAITVTALTDSKGYDGTNTSSLTPTLTGTLAPGDAATRSQTFNNKNVGTGKTLTPAITFTSGSASNYTITFVNNTTGVITARAITVTALTDTKGYDGTNTSSLTPTLTGTLAPGDAATRSQTFNNKNAGTGKTLTPAITFTSGSASNYTITFVNNTTGVITARAITVTAATNSKGYDGTTSSAGVPTITTGSLAGGDSATWTQTFDTRNVGTGKTLVPSGTVNDGNGGANYTITFVNNTTGVITARAITVTALTDSKGYDGTNTSSLTPTLTGTLAPGDAATRSQTFNNKNAGTGKTLTPAITFTSGSASNYTITFVNNTTGVITARAITVTAATNSKGYDGTTSSAGVPTITTGSLAGGDTANFSEAYSTRNVGTGKTLVPSGTVNDGNGGANYTITFVNNTTGVITARAITVTAATNSKGYDGTTSSAGVPTITTGSLAGGDTANFSEAYSTRNVGTGKTLVPSGTVNDGNGGANYTITFVNNTTGVITARAITVTALTDSKGYDGTTSSAGVPTITTGSLAGSDTANFSEAYSTRNVGTGKTLVPSGTVNDGNGGANYTITFVNNTTGVITARAITVTAATNSKGYDGTTSSAGVPTITTGSLAGGDSATWTQTFDTRNVGTGKTLVPSGTVNDGNGGANYTITFVNNTTGVITARAITVTALTDSKGYDGTNTSSLTPTLTGTLAPGDAATRSQTFNNKNAGTGKTLTPAITFTSGSASNYTITFVNNTTGVITKADPTIVVTPYSVTYNGSAHTATGTAKGILGEDLTGLDLSGTTHTIAGIFNGDAWTFTDVTGNYNDTSGTVTDDITKADAVCTITGYSVLHDGSAHTATGSCLGVDASVLVGLDLSGTTHTIAGIFNGDAWTFTDVTGDYNDTSGTVDDSIGYYSSTTVVTFEAGPYVYRGTPFTATAWATGPGGLHVSVPVVYSGDCTNVTVTGGCTATATFAGDTTHSGSSDSKSITITKASLTVTPAAKSRTYGDAVPAYTFGVSGFKNGEIVLTAAGYVAPTCTSTYTATTSVASSPLTISCSGGSATNYSFNTTATAALTIAKASLTVTPAAKSRTYGDAVPAYTFGVSGFKNGETALTAAGYVAPTCTSTYTATTSVASSPLTISCSGGSATNYSFNTTATAALTIAKASLTVTPAAKSRTYGDAVPAYTFGVSGFKNGEIVLTAAGYVAPTCTSTYTATTSVASSPLTISCSGGSATNYSFNTTATAALTIAKASLTVTPAAKSRTYGDAVPAYTFGVSGFKNGETALTAAGYVAPTCTSTYTATTSVASSPLTISCSGGSATNYSFNTTATAALTIAKASLTVTPAAKSRTYGDAVPAYTFGVSGFKNGEIVLTAAGYVAPTCTSTYTATTSVASSPLTISCSGGSATNYSFNTTATAALTIAKASLTVTPAAKSRTYGDAVPAYTFGVSGFKNGETALTAAGYVAPTCTSTYTATTSVASSPLTISCSGGSATNYSFNTTATAALTIAKASLTVTPYPQALTYGDVVDPIYTFGVSGFKNGETALTAAGYLAPTCTSAYTATTSVASSPLTISCSGGSATNYSFNTTASAQLTITKAVLSVNAVAASKVYGGSDPSFTATYSGFASGDSAGNSGITGTASCTRTAGTTVAGSPYTITCAPGTLAAPNYSFTTGTTAAFTITKKVLSVTGLTANNKNYDGSTTATLNTGSAALFGVIGGDTVTLNKVGAIGTFDTKYPGTGKTVTISGLTIGGASAGNYTLTQPTTTANVIGATYVPLTPTRILDTRDGTGGLSGAFSSHVARTFQVTGHGGVPSNAIAVTGNLTVTQQTSLGFLFIGPIAANNPTSSNLNFPMNDDRANAVTVALGAGGKLSITYAAPITGPTAHVIFDVTGYFVPNMGGATYFALTPTRILDTRDGTGGLSGAFSSHLARTFQVTGHGGVPSNAIAVTGNLTVTQQTSLGFLFIGPIAMNNPTSSNLNFPLNDDRANAVTVALGAGGKLSITYAAPILGPTAHVVFDVTGYFVPDTSGAVYVPLTPTRILDSRDGTGGLSGAFSSHLARTFQVIGHGGVPSNATAVTGNLTVTQQSSLGFLFIGPIAANNPTSSNLNFPLNDDRANAVTVALGPGGKLSITYAAPILGPTAHVIFDVTGYFVP